MISCGFLRNAVQLIYLVTIDGEIRDVFGWVGEFHWFLLFRLPLALLRIVVLHQLLKGGAVGSAKRGDMGSDDGGGFGIG